MVRRAGNWWHPFFFSSRRRHTRWPRDWSSDVCSSDLVPGEPGVFARVPAVEKSRAVMPLLELRSEERRVGKECRSRWRQLDEYNHTECMQMRIESSFTRVDAQSLNHVHGCPASFLMGG